MLKLHSNEIMRVFNGCLPTSRRRFLGSGSACAMRIDLPEPNVALVPSEAFLANPNTLTPSLHPEGESLFGHYLRAKCAGIAIDHKVEDILAALREPPDCKDSTSAVIGWFLGSMKV